MGQEERRRENAREGKRARAKEVRSRRANAAGNASWDNVDYDALMALIVVAADHDGAVRVGKTRDGGAWALGMYMGDDYATEYVRPAENFADAVHEIANVWLEEFAEEWETLYAHYKSAH